MVSQFSKLTVITFVVGAWQDGRSAQVARLIIIIQEAITPVQYNRIPPGYLVTPATPTIIKCRQGCAQGSTCITGGSYFFLLPPPHPPSPSPYHNNIIIILLLLGHSCCREGNFKARPLHNEVIVITVVGGCPI